MENGSSTGFCFIGAGFGGLATISSSSSCTCGFRFRFFRFGGTLNPNRANQSFCKPPQTPCCKVSYFSKKLNRQTVRSFQFFDVYSNFLSNVSESFRERKMENTMKIFFCGGLGVLHEILNNLVGFYKIYSMLFGCRPLTSPKSYITVGPPGNRVIKNQAK